MRGRATTIALCDATLSSLVLCHGYEQMKSPSLVVMTFFIVSYIRAYISQVLFGRGQQSFKLREGRLTRGASRVRSSSGCFSADRSRAKPKVGKCVE